MVINIPIDVIEYAAIGFGAVIFLHRMKKFIVNRRNKKLDKCFPGAWRELYEQCKLISGRHCKPLVSAVVEDFLSRCSSDYPTTPSLSSKGAKKIMAMCGPELAKPALLKLSNGVLFNNRDN